jgi:hypothetical protein
MRAPLPVLAGVVLRSLIRAQILVCKTSPHRNRNRNRNRNLPMHMVGTWMPIMTVMGKMFITLIFINDYFFFKDKKTLFVDFRTETLRTKLERVHFGSGIETRVFFSWKKKINHYENESMYRSYDGIGS